MAEPDLELMCPACNQRFGIVTAALDPQTLRVVCTACDHTLDADEILFAMAVSLDDLLDKTRDQLADRLDPSVDKSEP
jgi:predicted Zn finger-like uncharacterized protein